jgi:hypothetical protein
MVQCVSSYCRDSIKIHGGSNACSVHTVVVPIIIVLL